MRTILFLLVAIQGAVSQSVKSCGGPTDHLKNPVIKLTPDPPVKGGTLTIEASGTLDEVQGAFDSNLDLKITALGVVHASVTGSIPMSISPGAVAGPFSLTIGPFALPSSVPGSATVKGQVHVTNSKGEPILCVDLDLDVPGMGDEKALAVAEMASQGDEWTCSVCNHVYDPAKDGAGVAFESLPDTWKCPVCGQPKSAYKKSVEALAVPEIASQGDVWTCTVCNHVYDPAKDGAGVAFEALPDTWKCPVCGQPKSAYKKSVEAPSLTSITSCGKATDHIPDFSIASASGVTTMTGTLDEAVTKASIDVDIALKVLFISVPLKMTIPLAVSEGLIQKGAIKATVGPSTIAVSPDVKATLKGTMKISDGNGEEITCLSVDTVVATTDLATEADCEYFRKVADPDCGDVCLPATMGVCPRAIITKTGGLEAGKCADKGYTVDKGEVDQKAGPCGTLKIEQWAKAGDDVAIIV